MRILILSNGPSVKTFDRNMREWDLVIGVTKVATLFPCHWWVVGDDDVYESLPELIGEPMYVFANKAISIHKGADYLRDARDWLRGRYVLRWIDVPNARNFSGVAALALARYHLLAVHDEENTERIIDVYGVDLGGDEDCLGTENAHRDEGRWAREKLAWDAIMALCEGEGIDVCIHQPIAAG